MYSVPIARMPVLSWLVCVALGVVLLLVPGPATAGCIGDCDDDNAVTVDELITSVGIALGGPLSNCRNADVDGDQSVTVDELIAAVDVALSSCPPLNAPTPTPTSTRPTLSPTTTPTATPTGPDDLVPPTGSALPPWLQAGRYRQWTAESSIHASGGPHGGFVRTFLNDIVLQSLAAGNAAHPTGAALVKELYGSSDDTQPEGWAVEIKARADSAGGSGWYWYEGYGTSAFANGLGVPVCTGCHGADYRAFVSKDFVLSPYPLQ